MYGSSSTHGYRATSRDSLLTNRHTNTEKTWELSQPFCWCCVTWPSLTVGHCRIYLFTDFFLKLKFSWRFILHLQQLWFCLLNSLELRRGHGDVQRYAGGCRPGDGDRKRHIWLCVLPDWIVLAQNEHNWIQARLSWTCRDLGDW